MLGTERFEKGSIFEKVFENNKGNSQLFLEHIFSTLYPIKTLKRIIYRPLNGRWYPYADIMIQDRELQLSFLYDIVELSLSYKQYCCNCNQVLNQSTQKELSIPVALCSTCFHKLYFRYWDCLNAVIQKSIQETLPSDQIKSYSIELKTKNTNNPLCKNFLRPDCGFPEQSEKLNPCLENHRIGLVVHDENTIGIIIGTRNSIKNQMIWNGGCIGIIVGSNRQILNLERLHEKLPIIIKIIYQKVEKQKKNQSNSDNDVKILINTLFMNSPKEKQFDFCKKWLILAFLHYYQHQNIITFIDTYFNRAFFILRKILRDLLIELDLDLEVIEILDLIKCYTPINLEFREKIEHFIYAEMQIESIGDFISSLGSRKSIEELNWNKIFEPRSLYDLQNNHSFIEIYKILWSYGNCFIAELNISKLPVMLNLNELIGRKII